jgi:hypothetical protein
MSPIAPEFAIDLTMREWLAGQVLSGIFADKQNYVTRRETVSLEDIAKVAVMTAEATMKYLDDTN